MTRRLVATVIGTRPEAVKMAPVVRRLAADPDLESRLLLTGQHRDMVHGVLSDFGIAADADLGLMEPGQNLASFTARALDGIATVLRRWRPCLVLTHGDTMTTVAASLAAFYESIPSGHVEAGLRSGSRRDPFPEEMDRTLADQLADLLFAPTARARERLVATGADPERIYVTGNTAIDAFLHMTRLHAGPRPWPDCLAGVDWSRRIVVVETHRRENWDGAIGEIARAVGDVVRNRPDVEAVYSVHPNPVVADAIRERLLGRPRVHLCPPFDYPTWVRLLAASHVVVSDSGGLQEEVPAIGRPLVVTRRTTERPEAVEAGTAILAGTDYEGVARALATLLDDGDAHRRMSRAVNPFGDGRAAERTVQAVRHHLGLGPRPRDFAPQEAGA